MQGGGGREVDRATPTVVYISVLRAEIAKGNRGEDVKPIRVARGKSAQPTYVKEFTTRGTITVRFDPVHPMPWGAKVWLEIEEEPDATGRG